jgi:hypothetical protein
VGRGSRTADGPWHAGRDVLHVSCHAWLGLEARASVVGDIGEHSTVVTLCYLDAGAEQRGRGAEQARRRRRREVGGKLTYGTRMSVTSVKKGWRVRVVLGLLVYGPVQAVRGVLTRHAELGSLTGRAWPLASRPGWAGLGWFTGLGFGGLGRVVRGFRC